MGEIFNLITKITELEINVSIIIHFPTSRKLNITRKDEMQELEMIQRRKRCWKEGRKVRRAGGGVVWRGGRAGGGVGMRGRWKGELE